MEQGVQTFRKMPNLLDQLLVFVTVFEESSLSAAARRLNRAVSSVSYTLSQLELHAGCRLLRRDKNGIELTLEGEALFAEARFIVDQTTRLSAHMRALESGEEPTLRVLIDVLFPRELLARILGAFADRETRVRLQVFHASLNSMWDDLREGSYDMALALSNQVPLDMRARALGKVELSTYCASGHVLAALPGPLTEQTYRSHRQIYFVARPDIQVERVGRVFSTDVWTVDDIEMLRQMVIDGLGWSFGTEHTFRAEIATGQIVALSSTSPNLKSRRTVCLVQQLDKALGVLGQEFAKIAAECAATMDTPS